MLCQKTGRTLVLADGDEDACIQPLKTIQTVTAARLRK